jgi:hypothetical protein
MVRKRISSFAMPFYSTKTAIMLPRQARDKHRWKAALKKRDAFLQGGCGGPTGRLQRLPQDGARSDGLTHSQRMMA